MWWRKAVVGGALLLSVGAVAERKLRQRDRAHLHHTEPSY